MDFDAVVLGTGLTESIVAAALSKAGYKVGHLDANPYYGADDASLSVDEIIQWADERQRASTEQQATTYLASQRGRFTGISYSGDVPLHSRQFALSLCPTIIPSIGPLIENLIASGVSRYGGFKLLEQVALYEGPGVAKPVPGNKEDIFKNKQLSLVHKRRLMRFLMFAGGEFEGKPELEGNEETPFPTFLKDKFSLDDDALKAITYALAFCVFDSDPTLPALHRIRRYLRSTGRYGPSPFLFGHYGGVGELAQGFCRTAAVAGATYVLGRPVLAVQAVDSTANDKTYRLQLEDVSEELTCKLVLSAPDYAKLLPSSDESPASVPPSSDTVEYTMARGIAILDSPLSFTGFIAQSDMPTDSEAEVDPAPSPSSDVDTAILVFPPGSVPGGLKSTAVHAIVSGEASMSSPRGKWVLYLSAPLLEDDALSQTPEQLLRPYLEATLTLTKSQSATTETSPSPFTVFYKQHPLPTPPFRAATDPSQLLFHAPRPPHLPEIADSVVGSAEAAFWKAVGYLKAAGIRPQRKEGEEGASEGMTEVDSFWPPLEYIEEDADW